MNIKKQGFTLVELIVVVTILAILSTVGFVAYSGYLEGVRDTNRVSQLKSMSDALHLYSTQTRLPLPDNNVEVRTGTKVRLVQGELGANVIESIEYSSEGIDPKDKNYFIYSLSSDYKYFTIGAFLEEDNFADNNLSVTDSSYANNAFRYPYIEGSRLGIYLDDENNSIHNNSSIVSQGNIDITDVGSQEFQVLLSNKEKYIGSGNALLPSISNYDCKRIKDLRGGSQDGVYTIDPNGNNIGFQVYCDMTTDGGGWTVATMLGTQKTSSNQSSTNLFDTGDNSIITSISTDIRDKGNLDNVWTDTNNRDIMLHCFVEHEVLKGYEHPLVIYNFSYADKNNLTKLSKAGTNFSSEVLTARWRSHNYQLSQTYGSSSYANSMYLERNDALNSRIYLLKWNLGAGGNSGTSSYHYDEKGPAYNADVGGAADFFLLNDKNYCYSAVRSFGQ